MPATRWEYKVDIGVVSGGKPDVEAIRERLVQNGKDGWELIQVVSRDYPDEKEDWWVYKRPVPVPAPKGNNSKNAKK